MTGSDVAFATVFFVLVALLGLAIGSFLNVVIWRVPRGESVNRPPSACPRCGHRIRLRDNIPVLSWLLLRGRCRDCGEPISVRYPLIEAGTAVAFVFVAARFVSAPEQLWALPAYLYLLSIGVALTMIDLDTHRLPNAIVLPSYLVAIGLLTVASAGTADWWALLRALLSGAALFAFYLLLAVVVPKGMGSGDVKLAGVLGLFLGWLGWGTAVIGAFTPFVLGGIFSIALLATGTAGRKSGIPFGPWMLAGTAVGVFFGEDLADGYLTLVGLN